LPIPDCIYRREKLEKGEDRAMGEALYASEEGLWGALHPQDEALADEVAQELAALPEDAVQVCPLALGNHIDHQLTRRAAEQTGRELWYYADYPYILERAAELEALLRQGWQAQVSPVSDDGLRAWQESVAAHASQVSTFWESDEAMRPPSAGTAYRWVGSGCGGETVCHRILTITRSIFRRKTKRQCPAHAWQPLWQ
jgi:hypothetical protein